MNTKSSTIKAALLTLAAVSMHGQGLELAGRVPFDFKVNGKALPTGEYRVAEIQPGVVIVRSAQGNSSAMQLLPVHTAAAETSKTSMTFTRDGASFRLAAYCAAGHGCWEAMPPRGGGSAVEERIEVALAPRR